MSSKSTASGSTYGAASGAPTVTSLFPQGTGAFMRRRLGELFGAALAAFGIFLSIALISYSPGDPSWNSAAHHAANMAGVAGAFAADLSLQFFGVAMILPISVLFVWGLRLMRHAGMARTMAGGVARFVSLMAGLALTALAVSPLDTPDGWPLITGLGGVSGALGLNGVTKLAAFLGLPVGEAWVIGWSASFAAILAVGCLFAAMGLSIHQWISGTRAFFKGLIRAYRLAWAGASAAYIFARDLRDRLSGRFNPGLDLDDAFADDDLDATEDADTKDDAPPRNKPKAKKPSLVAPAKSTRAGKQAKAAQQKTLELEPVEGYQLPSLDFLEGPSESQGTAVDPAILSQNAEYLASVLQDFGVRGEIVKVRPGPVVTLYELEPAPGTKTSRVVGLSDDIARSMSAISVRIAVVPGRSVIGIELPNQDREMVALRELLASDSFERTKSKLPLVLGKDIGGGPVIADLATMPHLLIAGTTGSGKSVGINAMVLSLLYRLRPDQCRFIMIDPKMLELSVYDGIPHLLTPVVTDPKKAVVALKWAVREMEERYRAMSQLGVRNIDGFNARVEEAQKKGETLTRRVQTGFDAEGKPVFEDQTLASEPLPYIVVLVDEMADLMLVAGKDVEAAIQRLAQMARAAGIHLIMATQRPSVDVITGTIKANFPTRISFQVTSKIDSRTILGEQGAEQLLGRGDMLHMAGGGRLTRVHGPFVSDEEVEQIVSHLKAQGEPEFIEEVTREEEDGSSGADGAENSGDALYDQAVALVAREGKASTSFVQRHLQIGYNRAARLVEKMEQEGVVSPADRVGRREVLVGNH